MPNFFLAFFKIFFTYCLIKVCCTYCTYCT